MQYESLGGILAAIVFGAVAAWRRLTRKAKSDPEPGSTLVVRDSITALIRGLHRAELELGALCDDLGAQEIEPARALLLVAHNGLAATRTLRSQVKVRALAEDTRSARSMLEDWLDPRPMSGDYIALLSRLLERPGRAIVLDATALRTTYPTLRRIYEQEITCAVVCCVEVHEGGMYYVSLIFERLRERDRAEAMRALEATCERLRPIVTHELLSPGG